MQKELFKRKELLEEIRRFQSNQFEEIGVAKNAVRNIMGTASLIVSVVAAFLASNPQACDLNCAGSLKAVAFLYFLLAVVSVWSLYPVTLRTPLEISEKNMQIYYTSKKYKTEIAFIERVINRYLVAIEENLPAIKRRKSLAAWAGLFFGLMVIFLLLPQLGG